MQEWIYYGPHLDPHPMPFVSGMSRLSGAGWVVDLAHDAELIPPVDAVPFTALVTRLPDEGLKGEGILAMAFRERWKAHPTDTEVAASLFLTRNSATDPQDMLKGIERAFPEVWKRFEKITIGKTCVRQSPPKLLEA